MEIVIDERIELITVVQTLCNYWENLQIRFYDKPLYQSKYRENVKVYFEKYKEHKIVKLHNTLCDDIGDISAFLYLALCYSNPPDMNVIADYENNWRQWNSSLFPYKEFIDELRQFYIDTDFNCFYGNNQDEYKNMMNNYGNKAELSVNTAFDYYDIKTDNYKIILSSLVLDGGGFGIKVKTNENEIINYSIISPFDYKDNNYLFGSLNNKKSFLWHEIGHLIINDLTGNFINQFDLDKKQISEIYVKNLYSSIETIINEYIIRAITIRFFEMSGENEMAELLIKNDIKSGFEDVKLLKDHIKQNFEHNQSFVKDDRYKDLMEYVINLI